ncbi:MAG: hypothetical protein U0704_00530 [Candidatus Eisenbacteria bacterium]
MSDNLYYGRLQSSVSEVVDAGDLLPEYELAAIAALEGVERPGEDPAIRRHLRAEGIRPAEHRGTLLVDAAAIERISSVGLFGGGDEVYFSTEWNDEFEPFPGRISSDAVNFSEGTPLGLEEWMHDTNTVLVIGDGAALNYATTSAELHQKLAARYPAARK